MGVVTEKYKNIVIQGVTYPSASAAAAALGVTSSMIRKAVRNGRADGIGTRAAGQQVEIRGVTYPSFTAAAKALGVSAGAVGHAFKNGTLSRCGLGRSGPVPMRIQIAGKVFSDAQAAADHFGVARGSIYAAISDGDADRIARAPNYNPWKSKRFSVGGLVFKSMSEASRELGFRSDFIAKTLATKSKRGQERILAAAMTYAVERGQQ